MRSLYVSHIGMSEPLGRSQCLPYLIGLARSGVEVDVVAFEKQDAPRQRVADVKALMGRNGIGYHPMTRAAGHGLVVKSWESVRAVGEGLAVALRRRPDIIHGRSYLPAAVGDALGRLLPGAKALFDCRGLLGDEYVDGGNWSATDLRYRLLKRAERRLFSGSDGVVVLTRTIDHWLEEQGLYGAQTKRAVIPCCVDTGRFVPDASERDARRRRLGIGKDAPVVVYSGTLGSWYREPEMAAFVSEFFALRDDARFVIYTQYDPSGFLARLEAYGVSRDRVSVESVSPDDMPAALSVGDVGVSLIQPCFSKRSSSPTKIAEYLACGLLVVANGDVGDVDELSQEEAACVVFPELSEDVARKSARDAVRLYESRTRDARVEVCRKVAIERFDLQTVGIPRYLGLYRSMLGRGADA